MIQHDGFTEGVTVRDSRRVARLSCGTRYIEVSQWVEINGDDLLEEPLIGWSESSQPGNRHAAIRTFAAALLRAVEIAEKWDKDVGKRLEDLDAPQ